MHSTWRKLVLLSILVISVFPVAADAADTSPYRLATNGANELTPVGSFVYYATGYGSLRRTDGTFDGTVVIRDLQGQIREITPVGDKIFFSVDERELWVSDGTTLGTKKLRTFQGGNHAWGYVKSLTALGDLLIFAGDDGPNGVELWKSDGTAAGTVMVRDINPQPADVTTYSSRAGWSWPFDFAELNGFLYFRADDGTLGSELWRTDGTSAGTTLVRDINNGYNGSWPGYTKVLNGVLYFSADDGSRGSELWRSDGTAGGTYLVRDIRSGWSSSSPYYLDVALGKLFFQANDGVSGSEIWVSDGTAAGTRLLRDIRAGSASGSTWANFIELSGKVLFTADDGVNGSELWSSDGTEAGTALVVDLNPGSSSGGAYPMTRVGNRVYFGAYHNSYGSELWQSDGTAAGTSLVADLIPYYTAFGVSGVTSNGSLVFWTNNDHFYVMNSCSGPHGPRSLTATASASQVTLSWEASAAAIRYDVYRSDSDCPGAVFTKIGESASPTFVDLGANAGAVHSYKVKAVGADGCESLFSNCAVDVCTLPVPAITLSGAASACGYGQGGTATNDPSSDISMTYQWGYRTSSGGAVTDLPYRTDRAYTISASEFAGVGSYLLVCRTTSSCGRVAISNEIPIEITSSGIAPTIQLLDPEVCPGAVGYAGIEGSSSNYSSFQWTITNGTIGGYGANSSYVQFIAGTSGPVELTVAVIDNGGCSASASATVPLRSLEAPPIQLLEESICPGATGYAAVDGPNHSSFASYEWTIVNGTIVYGERSSFVQYTASGAGAVELTLRVVDNGGCTATRTVTVPLRTLEAPPIQVLEESVCPGGTGYAAVDGPDYNSFASYEWTIVNGTIVYGERSPYVQYTASGAGAVELSLRVVDNKGCAATRMVTVPIRSVETPVVTPLSSTTFCQGGSVVLTASPGASYLWSNGATTESIIVTQSGNYGVTVTDSNGCSAVSGSVAVVVNALPEATITVTTPGQYAKVGATAATSMCSGETRRLSAPFVAGNTYLWSNGATSPFIDVAAPGNYSVIVTNANGCSRESEVVTVNVSPIPVVSISASGATSFCPGGSVTLTAQGADSYVWSTGATTASIVVNATGNYTVTGTTNNCSASASQSVAVYAPPVASISADGPTTFCEGGSVTLTASGGTSFTWSNGATSQSITVTQGGNYSVSVTDSNTCSSTTSASIDVIVNPGVAKPTVVANGSTSFCRGGSVELRATVTGGTAPYSYQWYGFGGQLIDGATSSSYVAAPENSSYYFVRVTDAAGCSSESSDAVVVTVNDFPDMAITSQDAICPSVSGTASVADVAGSTYSWSITNGVITAGEAGSTVVFTAGASGAVTLTVNVSNSAGCSSTSSKTIAVREAVVPAVSPSGTVSICQGASVTLTASPGVSYLWSNGATSPSISVAQAGEYSVTVTDANGCSVMSGVTTVVANPVPVAEITTVGEASFCLGGSVTLVAGEGASYLWSNGATSRSIVVSETGDYSVTVTNASGCSAMSGTTSIVVNPLPVATISGETAFCPGGSVTLTASEGASYLWSNGESTRSIVVSQVGIYSVRVTDQNGCSATSSDTSVTMKEPPVATISAGGSTTFCAGGSVTLTASPGASYAWSNGATTQSIVATAAGPYTVVVTGANGCVTQSAPTTITHLPATTITKQPANVTIKKNNSTTLTVQASGSGAVTYQWYRGTTGNTTQPIGGATSSSYTTPRLSATTSYWVRVTASCGAMNSATATVTIR